MILETFRQALQNVWSNKLRTFLTMLGIIIGVMAVDVYKRQAIDWLDEHGITLHNVSSFGGASVKRIHRPVNDEGKVVSVGSYMIPLLEENCKKAGVQILLNTTANEILTDANGAAVGVKATGSTGETVTVNAKAVVLTTGGFGANLDMVVKYKSELKGFMTTNASGIQGQGIEMAEAIGAATVDMDQIQIHPTVEANTAAPVSYTHLAGRLLMPLLSDKIGRRPTDLILFGVSLGLSAARFI